MININSTSVFDFQSLKKFEDTALPLKQFSARDGAIISYRFYDSPNKDRIVILLHGSSAHVIDGVKHLDIVCNQEIMEKTAAWVETKTFSEK